MTKLRIPDSSLQGRKEVWVKCPKCGERFRPQLQNLDRELGLRPPPDAHGPSTERREAVDNILSQINLTHLGTRRHEDTTLILDALPVLPEEPPQTKIFLGITIALVVLLLGGLAWLFASAVAPPAATQPFEAPPPLDYGRDILLSDFLALRRDLLTLRHVDRTINYKGRESRIYKYYIPLLSPDLCQEITEIHLWSSRTADGFRMEGACADPKGETGVLEVRWDNNSARISLKDKPMELNLPLPRTIG